MVGEVGFFATNGADVNRRLAECLMTFVDTVRVSQQVAQNVVLLPIFYNSEVSLFGVSR